MRNVSFIPKNLYLESHINSPFNGRKVKVRYCYVTPHRNSKFLMDQYYHSNFSRSVVTSAEDIVDIDGIAETITKDTGNQFNSVFKNSLYNS